MKLEFSAAESLGWKERKTMKASQFSRFGSRGRDDRMKRSRFDKERIIRILKEQEGRLSA